MKRDDLRKRIQPLADKLADELCTMLWKHVEAVREKALAEATQQLERLLADALSPPEVAETITPPKPSRRPAAVAAPKVERAAGPRCSKCGEHGHNARTCGGRNTADAEVDTTERHGAGANHDRRERIAAHVAKSNGTPALSAPPADHAVPRPRLRIVETNPLFAGRHSRRSALRPRAQSIAPKRMRRGEARAINVEFAAELALLDDLRPKTRADCCNGPRPCPWVGCRHHLAIDINPETGSLQLTRPELEPWELPQSCALDVADAGACTLEQIGELLNVTRERTRQIEIDAIAELAAKTEDFKEAA